MAARALGICQCLLKPFQRLAINDSKRLICTSSILGNDLLSTNNPSINSHRTVSFFTKLPADSLWKSVISVSNAGAKKGRGRGAGRKRSKNLNRGQVIGKGKINMIWPGLSSPVIKGQELVKQQQLPEDTERMANLIKLRNQMASFRRLKLAPIERGWSGAKMPGRSLGPPDPIGEDHFEGFNSIILEFKSLLIMRGGLGRTRKISALVVTGNGNGLAGFAIGKGKEGAAALRKAKNRAGQKLMHIDIFNNHSIYHDFVTQFGKTRIYVYKRAEGYGLQCHRAIKAICQVMGIKDMHAKVEGSMNLQNIVRAFFIGLLQQKSHQQLADEKKLHLVEFRKENEYFPKVVASPDVVRKANEIKKNEVLDFTQYVNNNKVVLQLKKYPPFYTKLPHWNIYLKKFEKRRNHEKIRMDMYTEYGELKSFLNDKYPDTNPPEPDNN